MLLAVNADPVNDRPPQIESFDKVEIQILREFLDEIVRHACPHRKNVTKKLLVLVESGMN